MHVQCIAPRSNHVDLMYGTGPWNLGEIKDVPDDTATRMLRHRDVYTRPTAEAVEVNSVKPVSLPDDAPIDPTHEVYDQLQNYTFNQLQDFIKTNFNVTASKRQFPTVDALRSHARMLFEQYGVLR